MIQNNVARLLLEHPEQNDDQPLECGDRILTSEYDI